MGKGRKGEEGSVISQYPQDNEIQKRGEGGTRQDKTKRINGLTMPFKDSYNGILKRIR